MRCQDETKLRMPLPSTPSPSANLGQVPTTTGQPGYSPNPDQVPFAYDSESEILYFYSNDAWKSIGMAALNEVNLANTRNLDYTIKVPIIYESGDKTVQGYVTLKEFKSL